MIDGWNFFDQPRGNNLITYDNIQKNSTDEGDDYTTSCLLNYDYVKKMIAVDLSKLEALDADTKSIQQINFTGNLEEQPKIFFVTEEAKETILDSSQGNVKLFWYKFLL